MKLRMVPWILTLGLGFSGCGPSPAPSSQPILPVQTNPASATSHAASPKFIPIQPVQTSDIARASLILTTNVQRFHLPDSFRKPLEDRVFLDLYEASAYVFSEEVQAGPRILQPIHSSSAKYLHILHSQIPPPQLSHWKALNEKMIPLRGYRAAILDQATNDWPAMPQPTYPSPELEKAAAILEQELSRTGLLGTLARLLEVLGASAAQANPAATLIQLRSIGFPIDLLSYFHPASLDGPTPSKVLAWVASKLAAGPLEPSAIEELRAVPFQFRPSLSGFTPVFESAGVDIGTIRMQIGGGYKNGIIPGGSLDMVAQLVAAMPKVNFILSVPSEFLGDVRNMAGNFWTLHRPGQVTLLGEPLSLTAWAQDNGKSGLMQAGANGALSLATLVPRYACQGEGESGLMPGDTFLADGLRAAGQVVAQSPLLFQGGNLMPVEDPKTHQRLLLLGEAELHRNVALGLSTNQTLEAFRTEFAADRCLVIPVVSFHIDFDVSLRQHQGQMIAFVNDPMAAARLILERGVEALAENHVVSNPQAQQWRSQLSQKDFASAHAGLSTVLRSLLDAKNQFPAHVVRWFAKGSEDAPATNLRYFLLALDLVASHVYPSQNLAVEPDRQTYGAALRQVEIAARAQVSLFQNLGWTVVPVPSMPDVASGINYLNGLHDAAHYFMPAHGGFYKSMDEAAMAVFRQTLGSTVQIVPIGTLESQSQHGAIHCAASIFPKIPATHNAQGEPSS